jgi:hypothetical protein
MTRSVYYCALFVAFGLLAATSIFRPALLAENAFLLNFVNHELINTMCVIATITLASTSQIHLHFNAIEERFKKQGLSRTRAGVRQAAYGLIALLGLTVVLVTVRPAPGQHLEFLAFCNGMALFILFWSILILLSITRLVFAIKPLFDEKDE